MSAISVEGFGSVTWWGFTPALDLTSIAKDGTEMDVCMLSTIEKTKFDNFCNQTPKGSGLSYLNYPM